MLGIQAYAFLTIAGVKDCPCAADTGLTRKVAMRTAAGERPDETRDFWPLIQSSRFRQRRLAAIARYRFVSETRHL